MKIDVDPEKDRLNTEKHGLSLLLRTIIEGAGIVMQDARFEYGEERFVAFGTSGVDSMSVSSPFAATRHE
jgi:uncharacterized DUF497 family protein